MRGRGTGGGSGRGRVKLQGESAVYNLIYFKGREERLFLREGRNLVALGPSFRVRVCFLSSPS